MDIVGIDFLHLDVWSGGYQYTLVITDHFTRFTQAYPTTNKSAKTAAQKLYNDFTTRFGTPNRLLHDQGKEFKNRLLTELNKLLPLGIERRRTTPHHPQCNELVERMNSTICQIVRTLSETCKSRWKDEIYKLVYAYNCSKHSVTNYRPHPIFSNVWSQPKTTSRCNSQKWPWRQHVSLVVRTTMEETYGRRFWELQSILRKNENAPGGNIMMSSHWQA